MSKEVEKRHILGLQPKQQAALHLLLYNFIQIAIEQSFAGIVDSEEWAEGDPVRLESLVAKKQRLASKSIQTFYSLIELFATTKSYAKFKPKIIAVTRTALVAIETSLIAFESDAGFLDNSDADFVMHQMGGLKKLVAESMLHEYTLEELKKEGVK